MRRPPLLASCVALLSVFAAIAASAVGCGDTAPATTSGTASSGSVGESSASASGSGGGASSSGGVGGSGGGVSASSSSGVGGSGGAASSSSASSSGSSASTGSGSSGGLGDPCTTAADCGMPPPNSALFCDKPGCGAGLGACALQPTNQLGLSSTEAAVCGCDDVTYWNADYAAYHGISIASQGACSGATAVACDTVTPCPGTMKCNRLVADQAQCAPSAPGTCWSMPVSCPIGGPAARACSNSTCQSMCDLVQSQNPWWNDPTCP